MLDKDDADALRPDPVFFLAVPTRRRAGPLSPPPSYPAPTPASGADVRPASDLDSDCSSGQRIRCQRSGRPVILTRHGRRVRVLMSVHAHEGMQDTRERLELRQAIDEAERDLAEGHFVDSDVMEAKLERRAKGASSSHGSLVSARGTGLRPESYLLDGPEPAHCSTVRARRTQRSPPRPGIPTHGHTAPRVWGAPTIQSNPRDRVLPRRLQV